MLVESHSITAGPLALYLISRFLVDCALPKSLGDRRSVANHKFDDVANLRNFFGRHTSSSREDENALGKFFGFRQRSRSVGEQGSIRLHTVTAREEIATGQNVFSPKNLQQGIAADLSERFVDFQDNVLVVVFFLLVEGQK